MKQFIVILILLITCQISQAQINEIGVYLGGSNFVGDVGSTTYIAPKELAIGAVYKWNRSPRHAYRFSVVYTDLVGIDNDSDDPSRIQRNYEFTSSILELSAGVEFTFFDFDLHKLGPKSTPYIYTGVSVAFHDNFFFNNQGDMQSENTSSQAWGIPVAVGYKTKITDKFLLSLEIGARATFSDEIDGSVPDNPNLLDAFSFGNINNNDFYVFTGFTLTYTFGRNPCFCNF
ncbi:DUF6089 family protein [Aurantibacter sp.]|uniref:type IX secretion system protein PorG n=1 Tax=Aurantibacter sp. TaxID=2807103 RepID=UPI0035C86B3B